MIDFLLGCIVTGAVAFLIHHFGPKATETFLLNFERRFQTMLSEAFNAALQRLEQAVDAKVAGADTGPAVDAEATAAVNGLADKYAPADQPQP